MLSRTVEYISPEEYLRLEAQSPLRHEYGAGQIFAMTGASIRHNLIALGIAAALRAHLKSSPAS